MADKKSIPQNVIISTKTLIISASLLLVAWLFIQIYTVFLALFISLMLALGFAPLVEIMEKKRIPRGVAVMFIYFMLLLAVIFISAVAFKPLISQTTKLINSLPAIFESLGKIPIFTKAASDLNNFIAEQIVGASSNLVKVTVGAFSGLLSVFSVLVFTAYLLLDLNNVREAFLYFFSEKSRKEVRDIITEIEVRLGSWLRGESFLMLIVGGATYIGLLILGVEYAAPLALISGLLEIVPIIGPIISTVPAIIVGFSQSPVIGLGVLALYILIQQLENNFIVPKVMQKAVGFNPLVTLLALLVGGKLFGVVGALVSVPVTLVVVIIAKHVLEYES